MLLDNQLANPVAMATKVFLPLLCRSGVCEGHSSEWSGNGSSADRRDRLGGNL